MLSFEVYNAFLLFEGLLIKKNKMTVVYWLIEFRLTRLSSGKMERCNGGCATKNQRSIECRLRWFLWDEMLGLISIQWKLILCNGSQSDLFGFGVSRILSCKSGRI